MVLFPHNPWILSIINKGFKINFLAPPPLTRNPLWRTVPASEEKANALRLEVQALLEKQATEIVCQPHSLGFYSHLFVVPKPGGKWRPVIDLSCLSNFIQAPRFQNGDSQICASVSQDQRICNLRRSLGRLPSHPHAQSITEVSQVRNRRDDLRLQSSSIRAKFCLLGFSPESWKLLWF